MTGPDGGCRIGVISDTHGVVHPRVAELLSGVDVIVHAGDVGSDAVLYELGSVARVEAVRGNMDSHPSTTGLPVAETVRACGTVVVVSHKEADALRAARTVPDADVVVWGHTHSPLVERRGPVLCVNPGSASRGHRRTVAVIDLREGRPEARVLELDG